jgi:hypothetical protein
MSKKIHKEFKAFLKEHKALKKFKRNLTGYKSIKEYAIGVPEEGLVAVGFVWSMTEEGCDYWHTLYNLWVVHLRRSKPPKTYIKGN